MATSLEMVAVVAMARNRVIGDGSGLIWHLPADLKRVKSLTMGCPLTVLSLLIVVRASHHLLSWIQR